MNDMAYYRNLIENLLKEQPDDDIPRLPSRDEIEKRKFAHQLKMGRLPKWVEKVNIDNGIIYFGQHLNDFVSLGDGWSIVDWHVMSQILDDRVFIDGIYVYLEYMDGNNNDDNEDYDDDNEDDNAPIDKEMLCNEMNKILTNFFEIPVNDVEFASWYDKRIVSMYSRRVADVITSWTPILLKK